ncbi:MAG: hypothetical protein HY775_11830 [Acidobacteria bacterium]|nr:hypothetical protein [Acidobacteriota bacterium]
MKRKVGTSLDATLYERARAAARREGRSINDLIEDGLRRVVGAGSARAQTVRETWATYRVPGRVLDHALREDLYDPE